MFRVEYTVDKGRHVIAAEKITAGEVIAVDTAVINILTPDTVGNHCSHCMVSTITPVYCSTCTAVVFCSNICREEAMNNYHKYECPLGLVDLNRLQMEKSLNNQSMDSFDLCDQSCSSVLLLLRFFTQKSHQYFKDMRSQFEDIMKQKSILDNEGEERQYVSSDYTRLVGLVSHRFVGQFHHLIYIFFIFQQNRCSGRHLADKFGTLPIEMSAPVWLDGVRFR